MTPFEALIIILHLEKAGSFESNWDRILVSFVKSDCFIMDLFPTTKALILSAYRSDPAISEDFKSFFSVSIKLSSLF
ncbi:hypothetical protein ES703_94970 [subsurface metagenome]